MSQDEILKFLNKHKGEIFTARDLQAALHMGTSIFSNLQKLRDEDEIEVVLLDVNHILTRGYYVK